MNDIIENPNYLAYKFNFNTESIEFIEVSNDDLRQLSFLKHDLIGLDKQFISIPLSDVVEVMKKNDRSQITNPPRFIFHTAFCASTFLSRCLDVPGVCLSLREPQLLLDAANAKRMHWSSKTTALSYRDLPKLTVQLLQKHAKPNEKLIIKPINSVNNIIEELLEGCTSSKSLLLYTDVRNFLLSSLKKGEFGKQTTRAMFDLLRCDFPHLANLSLSNVINMSDMKVILTLWRLQIDQAESAIKEYTSKNMLVSIHGETIISNPLGTLNAVNEYLDLGISTENIKKIIGSDKLSVDAKEPKEEFSAQKRDAKYKQIEAFYGADISNGINWMLQNNPTCSATPKLAEELNIN